MYHQSTDTIKIIPEEESKQFEFNEINIPNIKFKKWLKDIGLEKYYPFFEQSLDPIPPDTRDIKSFDDMTLIEYGMKNKSHRNRIVDAAKKYGKQVKKFDRILEQNKVYFCLLFIFLTNVSTKNLYYFCFFSFCLKILEPFAAKFKNHGIMTLNDLQQDINSPDDLQRILNLKQDDRRILDIWHQIHPQLRPGINKLQSSYNNIIVDKMGKFMEDLEAMNDRINAANILCVNNNNNNDYNDDITNIKQEYDKLINKAKLQLLEYNDQLYRFRGNEHEQSLSHVHSSRNLKASVTGRSSTTNTITTSNSSSKESIQVANTITSGTQDTINSNNTNYNFLSKTITNGEGLYSHHSRTDTAVGIGYITGELLIYGYLRREIFKDRQDIFDGIVVEKDIINICIQFFYGID